MKVKLHFFEFVFYLPKAYIEVTQLDFIIVRGQYFMNFRPQILYIARTGAHLSPLAFNIIHIVQTRLIYI